MKWVYSIKNRMTIAILLMVVFVSVFVKNILDEENVSDLTTSCSTIYQDRLLPESYIYHLSDFLYKKQMLINDCNDKIDFMAVADKNASYNMMMDSILVDFKSTFLTKEEAVALKDLQHNIESLYTTEVYFVDGTAGSTEFEEAKRQSIAIIGEASENLQSLSKIQLTVGKQVNEDSKRIMAGSSILSKFETALLIVLAVVINALIFGVISSRSKVKQRAHWN